MFYLGLEFFETSAKENINVKAVFEKLVEIICSKMAESIDSNNQVFFHNFFCLIIKIQQQRGHRLEATTTQKPGFNLKEKIGHKRQKFRGCEIISTLHIQYTKTESSNSIRCTDYTRYDWDPSAFNASFKSQKIDLKYTNFKILLII